MFGRKKAPPEPKSGKGAGLVAQMGLGGDMDDINKLVYGDDGDDASYEDELAALMDGGGGPKPRPKQRAPVPMSVIEQMAATDFGEIGNEEELSGDEDELMAELEGITGDDDIEDEPSPKKTAPDGSIVNLLQERLNMYDTAIINGKAAGESSKVKRYERGFKSLQDLLKKAKSGKAVDESEVPPPVNMGKTPASGPAQVPAPVQAPPERAPAPSMPTPSLPPPTRPPAATEIAKPQVSSTGNATHDMLVTRRDLYKEAALKAKHAGDIETAKAHVRVAKQFDSVIQALKDGQEIDLSQMPPPPSNVAKASPAAPRVERSAAQASSNAQIPENLPEFSQEEEKETSKAPDTPKTVLEALEQRLVKYQETQKSSEGSKARRYGRIVKQYQDSIKAHKAGKPVDYEELPTPPGFGPIPVQSAPKPAPAANPAAGVQRSPAAGGQRPPGAAAPPQRSPSGQKPAMQRSPQGQSIKQKLSLNEQQERFLLERQKQFKMAALEAKNSGNLQQAKTYLRMAKGFDPMILAAQSGLPVDLSKCPAAPHANDKVAVIVEDNSDDLSDRDGMYKKLETTLKHQIQTCRTNSKHFVQLGDVASSTKFDKMAENCRKDMDALANAYKHNDPVPRFHYELRSFSMMQCNPDLGDSAMELVVVRGVQFGLPSGMQADDLDTYVKFELPYPSESPQSDDSSTVKNTNSPEYDETFRLQINRKARTFARVVKSKSLKVEVFYKRGFLKSDKVLGSVNLKLDGLESRCTLHESLDLMDGRKAVGGKLELKLRIREPLTTKQVEEVKEKWLVIDKFERRAAPPAVKSNPQTSHKSAPRSVQRERSPLRNTQTMSSLKVLNFERQLLEKEMINLKGKITPQQMAALSQKSQQLQQQISAQEASIKQGGLPVMKTYIRSLGASIGLYIEEAQKLQARGYKEKARLTMQKKELIEAEYKQLHAKYGV